MADLLSEVEYGRILGSFTAVAEDFGDTVAPDSIPLNGSITFVPSKSYVSYVNSSGETASLYVAPVNAVITQGRIVGSDGSDGVVLLASNSNNVSASVLWTAKINLDPINTGDPAPEPHDFLIEVRRGEIVSLIDVIKANSLVHNVALFNDAIAEAAAAFWARVEAGEFRGNQGPPGPAGGPGVGVPGPLGIPGKAGVDGSHGVGGNIIPDGDLETPGFLVSGDFQESTDAVSGSKAARLSNATSRKILLDPDKSYRGTVYVKSDTETSVSISLRVFGPQGDISRVIENSYSIPADTWRNVTFLLDAEVGDQSVEIITQTDGRQVTVDQYTLSDETIVKGLQRDLSAARAQLEAAMAQLDTDLIEVDSERERLAGSLNDLAVVLEDANVDLTAVNTEIEALNQSLADEATRRQEADEAAQIILNQLDTNLTQAKQDLEDNQAIIANLDTDLESALVELNAAAANIETLETVTLPNLRQTLEDANNAAIQQLTALDEKLYGATGDITAAKANITQLEQDLVAEAEARALLAQSTQQEFATRDDRLQTAEDILSAAFPDGAVNVPEELSQVIKESVVQYAVSSSDTVPPTTGWSTASPVRDEGQYIWFRSRVTYGNGSTDTSTAALLTGNTGPEGPQGPKGVDGKGVSILGSFNTEAELPATGNAGDAYLVGGYLYVWGDGSWNNVGLIRGPEGVQGPPGADGAPRYTWIKYATSATGANISDDPAGKAYIGLAYNKTVATESNVPGDYQWALIQGPKGDTGSQGLPGPAGADGESLYTWLKYADTPTSGMSDLPDGKKYMGIAYNKPTPTESNAYSEYTWTLVEGPKGDQGIQGPVGPDGQSLYTWIKYATSSSGAGMSDSPVGKTYIGLAYNKTTSTESSNAADYSWSLIQGPKGDTGSQGIQGPPGADGTSRYTWIKYANTPTSGMADLPDGKQYMGIAYNKTVSTESTNYNDYAWSLIEGPKGDQGIQGPPGANGATTYTWIKYGTSSTGAGMSDSPVGKTYIGIAYNKATATESSTPGDYEWSLIQGPKGDAGSQGIQGPPGADGTSLYTWIKYADTPASGMSDLPDGKKYMGIAYNRTSSMESTVYSDYSWSLIEGPKGDQGIQGPAGADGQPRYTWIKYGTSSAGAGMSDSPTGKTYIGIAYNKTTATESSTASDYEWSLIQGPKGDTGSQGIQGPPGADGSSLFTWLKYADTPTSGMSDSPTGKKYMGIAYNKASATESSTYSDYDWSLIEGPKGDQGIQGPAGANGQPTYTWIKYGTSAAGAGMSDSPTGKTYIGIAYNKTTATESNTPGDYEWSLIQGPQGVKGDTGATGSQGISVTAITPYFQDVAAGAAAPAKPTTATPSGWSTTEPAWAPNRDLYRVEKVTFSNGSFSYNTVTKIAAYAGIDAAMAAANGKNLNTYTDLAASSKPGPAPAPNSARTVGDVHRNRDSSTGEIFAEYQWTGSAWKPISFGDSVLTSLDVGKVTGGTGAFQQFFADKFIADDATINKLWADKLVAKSVAATALTIAPGNLLPNGGFELGTEQWVGLPGSVVEITDSPGQGTRVFRTNALNHGSTTEYGLGNHIQAGVTTAHENIPADPGDEFLLTCFVRLVSGASTGEIGLRGNASMDGNLRAWYPVTINSGTMEVGKWYKVSGTFSVPAGRNGVGMQIYGKGTNTNAVFEFDDIALTKKTGAVLIQDGAVNADKINAESGGAAVGQFVKVETSNLIATSSIKTPEAVVEKLWADGIAAKTVETQKVVVATGNMIPDGDAMASDAQWSPLVRDTTDKPDAVPAARRTAPGQSSIATLGNEEFTVIPGQEYSAQVWVKADKPNSRMYLEVRRVPENSQAGNSVLEEPAGANTPGSYFLLNNQIVPTEWTLFRGTWTPSPGVTRVRMGTFYFNHGNGTERGAVISIAGLSLKPKVGAVLIENGAVNASKINAESVGAAVGEFVKLDVKNLTASSANINSLVAQRIAAGTAAFQTVNADKIIASSGTMNSAVINQIWADGIAAKSVIASRIAVSPGNVYRDPDLMDPAAFYSNYQDFSGGKSGRGSILIPASTVLTGTYDNISTGVTGFRTRIDPGRTYRMGVWFRSSASFSGNLVLMYIRMYNSAGTQVGANTAVASSSGSVAANTWTWIENTLTVHADAVELAVGFYTQAALNAAVRFSDPLVAPMVGAVLIEDGAVSADHLTSNSVTTAKLTTNAVIAEKIASGAVTTDKMVANSINGDRILANSLDAGKITANTITASKIASKTITAAQVATRTLLATNIVANAITADEIKANTITAAEILAGTITASEIATRTLKAENIVTGAITANEIMANTITAAKIAAGTITANEIDTTNLSASTAMIDGLWANGINAKTLTASRLSVAPGNIFVDPYFQETAAWAAPGVAAYHNAAKPSDSYLRIVTATSQRGTYFGSVNTPDVIMEPGAKYRVRFQARTSGTAARNCQLSVRGFKADGTTASVLSVGITIPASTAYTWSDLEGVLTIPTDWDGPATLGFHTRATYVAGENMDFRRPIVQRMAGAVLIEDGAITSDKMTANSIHGDRITAGTIVAEKITSGSFTGKTFTGGTFEGTAFRGGSYATSSAPANDGGVMIDPVYGLRAWDSGGQTLKLGRGENFLSGRISTTRDGQPGIILTPISGGGGGLWFTQTGSASGTEAAIYSALDGNIHIRPKVSTPAGTVFIDGNFMVNNKMTIDGSLDAESLLLINAANVSGLILRATPTSSSAPNMYRAGSGIVYTTTSSRRYKKNIANWSPSPEAVLALQPRQWQHDDPANPPDEIDETWHVGFVAEEVHDLGLSRLVRYAGDGVGGWRPDGLNYDRFAAAQQVVLKDHESRVQDLEATVEALMAEIQDLRSKI